MPRLFLLDSYALLYRAYYAMIGRPLTTASGENTSAPYGMARFLMRLMADHAPDYLAAVFDAGDSGRTEIDPGYKATRKEMPKELRASLPRCREIMAAFQTPVIEAAGWEADDVIGTLAGQAASQGIQTVIVSGDKDFYQLVDDHTWLLNPGRGGPGNVLEEWIRPDNAEERLGVPPKHVTDYLALLGDTSDNVQGVPGIGKKTAPTLIQKFGGVEPLLERVDEVTPTRARRALRQHADNARRSKELVTIRTDAPVSLDLNELAVRPVDIPHATRILRELEFHGLLRELGAKEVAREDFSPEHVVVTGSSELAGAVSELKKAAGLSIVVVTGRSGRAPDGLVGLALAPSAGRGFYFPLGHTTPRAPKDIEGNPVFGFAVAPTNLPSLHAPEMRGVRQLLESRVPKLGHGLKRAARVLGRAGVVLGGLRQRGTYDADLASYCLAPSRRERGLAALGEARLQVTVPSLEALTGTGRKRTPVNELSPEDTAEWAVRNAAILHKLARVDLEELDRFGMGELFREVELPLILVLAAMEEVGVAIDPDLFESLRARIHGDLKAVRLELKKHAGEDINLRSVPQLRALLFEKLGLPVIKKAKTGPSTDESVLVALAAKGHEVPALILEHRELDKLDNTYVSVLPRLAEDDGRIHTSFNQTVATTGRLSSSDPNLQNIPIRRALGREIRRGFVAAPGSVLIAADYSQIELRILAHLSEDPAFVRAFREDRDIHVETAARIFGVPPEDVTSRMRDQAKTINFATIYGQGAFALAGQVGVSYAEAGRFIEAYFERFAGVADFIARMKEEARARGYVETIIGRRRYIPEIRSPNPGIKGYGERTAVNSPIQGSAADLIKVSMIRLHDRLIATGAHLLLQVHDELLVESPRSDVEGIAGILRTEMEGAAALSVPLKVDMGVGENWYECKFG